MGYSLFSRTIYKSKGSLLALVFILFFGCVSVYANTTTITICPNKSYASKDEVNGEEGCPTGTVKVKIHKEEKETKKPKILEVVPVMGHRLPKPVARHFEVSVDSVAWSAKNLEVASPYDGSVNNSPKDGKTDEEKSDCPVQFITGKKIEVQVDWVGSGENPLTLKREYYNEKNALVKRYRTRQFGEMWKTNFDKYLIAPSGKIEDIKGLELNLRSYRQVSKGKLEWRSAVKTKYDAIIRFKDNKFEVNYHSGVTERYYRNGSLFSSHDIRGIGFQIAYLSGSTKYIDYVIHTSGQKLVFNRKDGKLVSVLTPEGLIRYSYETYQADIPGSVVAREQEFLSEVDYPGTHGNIQLIYDNSNWFYALKEVRLDNHAYKLITYVPQTSSTKIKTSGLVGGVNTSSFEYEEGKTTVTNALGAKTEYFYDQGRLKEIKRDGSDDIVCPTASSYTEYDDAPQICKV